MESLKLSAEMWKAFDDAIQRECDTQKKDRLTLIKEYFTNPEFAKKLHDYVWEINQEKAVQS